MTEEKESWEQENEIRGFVWCRKTLRPIDLTSMNPELIREISPDYHYSNEPRFEVTCPFCIGVEGGWIHTYNYSEIKPLENWKDAERMLDRRITALEKIANSPQFSAKVARKIMHRAEAKGRRQAKTKAKPETENKEKGDVDAPYR